MRVFNHLVSNLLILIALVALGGIYITHVTAFPTSSLSQREVRSISSPAAEALGKGSYLPRPIFRRAFGPDDIIYIVVGVCALLGLIGVLVCIMRGKTCV